MERRIVAPPPFLALARETEPSLELIAAVLFGVRWAKARAEQVSAHAVTDRTEEVLLDDERLALLDAGEAIRDVEPVTDLRRVRLGQVEHDRVTEPGPAERARVQATASLAESRRGQRPELRVLGEARCDRGRVLRGDPRHESF
jgi:hypothetical protein